MPIEIGGRNAHNYLTDHGTIHHIHHATHCQTVETPYYYQEFMPVLKLIAVDYSSLYTFYMSKVLSNVTYTKGGA
jgi:hypothetical protein